jgi:hypothetical protein
MTRILFFALMLLAQAATAQPTTAPGQEPMDIEAERRRIQAERLQEAERHKRHEAACYARFAVSDCLLANRAQRREVLDQLQKQESAIHAQERKEKAFEQLQRVRDKAAAKDSVPAAVP